MTLDAALCYQALAARDSRFDGRFFVAVKTTGVYCRPICAARTPRRENVEFFVCAAAAAEVALSAGPGGVRQFDHTIRESFGRSPRELRRRRRGGAAAASETRAGADLVLRLAYRPPLDWTALLEFLRARATPAVEEVDGRAYRRTIEWQGHEGTLEVSPLAGNALALRLSLPVTRGLVAVAARVRRMFDLDADPLRIAEALAGHPVLDPLLRSRPGLRVPRAWDPFELAVRAVLGQQVSVGAATTVAGRLAARYGRTIHCPRGRLTRLFPRPETLVDADLSGIGLTRARAATLRGLARAVAGGTLRLDAALAPHETADRLLALPGIGPWTVEYVLLRGLGEPDVFPCGDLGLRRALADGHGLPSAREIERIAEEWRPWRSYAALHLWMGGGAPAGAQP
ncbi:MAG: 3-methyladenine DNA glycosylase 2 [Deltaproteobacteria bacterium]|nr:3-methyladenine DNA glycosylase 2 [Deltaproteobacteria bacterium]